MLELSTFIQFFQTLQFLLFLVLFETNIHTPPTYTEKTVFFNQRNIFFIFGQRKNFFELKKVLLIQKKFPWSKEIDLFTLKKILLGQQNFFQFKEIFSLTAYQRNVYLIQRNFFLGVMSNWPIFFVTHFFPGIEPSWK